MSPEVVHWLPVGRHPAEDGHRKDSVGFVMGPQGALLQQPAKSVGGCTFVPSQHVAPEAAQAVVGAAVVVSLEQTPLMQFSPDLQKPA